MKVNGPIVFMAFLLVGFAGIITLMFYIAFTPKEAVWVDYEVKILDKDKVVLYRSANVSDSLVFRCNSDIFIGTEVIQKLEHKIP